MTWLEVCTKRHVKCTTARAQRTNIPTRLLEIDAPSPGQIRLVDSSHPVQYATLSHCWGSSRPLTLTTGSRDQLYAGVEFCSLPLSFQDAVTVARKLCITFIWIDCLCIYQDSEGDWRRKAASMSDVYRGSLLNIAATAAANSHDGFFQQRDPGKLQPLYAQASFDGLPPACYRVFISPCWEFTSRLAAEPLLRRGWVVQERILAPSVLHYAKEQIWWECHELVANETYPDGLPPEEASLLREERGAAELLQTPRKADPDEWLHGWEALCEMYSQTALTKSSDKLIAISGMAKRMQENF